MWALPPDKCGAMGEFHIKRIVLPSGKTVEIVYYQTTGSDPVISDVHEIEAGPSCTCARSSCATKCGGDRVHPTDWNEVEELRWQLALRCPDCEWRHVETYDAPRWSATTTSSTTPPTA